AASAIKFTKTLRTGVDPDKIKNCFPVPGPASADQVYFLRLQLTGRQAKPVSINWYWLSGKNDSLDWNKSKWYYTPQSGYADFSALTKLPPTTLNLSYSTTKTGDRSRNMITVTNTGKSVAFFLHLRALRKKGGEDILPVIFEDNYLLLAPGESRIIECSYLNKDAGVDASYISASAWNLDQEHSKAGKNTGFVNELTGK
ncbi:MAG TPA: glycoside hydrolase family 2 protein, partial [Puia sp.]|nr:glycoside hydrolase family 2 protein [Puia sp.]